MSGQTDLSKVLSSMEISCDDVKYGFACVREDAKFDPEKILGTFREKEGLTLIAPVNTLEGIGIGCSEGPFAKLTIEVHTSLDLVGLTATLTSKLREGGISANVIAAFYHDHIFVQFDLKDKAIKALTGLT
jgi:hypothetical protein